MPSNRTNSFRGRDCDVLREDPRVVR
jgi:hypothetical protein